MPKSTTSIFDPEIQALAAAIKPGKRRMRLVRRLRRFSLAQQWLGYRQVARLAIALEAEKKLTITEAADFLTIGWELPIFQENGNVQLMLDRASSLAENVGYISEVEREQDWDDLVVRLTEQLIEVEVPERLA